MMSSNNPSVFQAEDELLVRQMNETMDLMSKMNPS